MEKQSFKVTFKIIVVGIFACALVAACSAEGRSIDQKDNIASSSQSDNPVLTQVRWTSTPATPQATIPSITTTSTGLPLRTLKPSQTSPQIATITPSSNSQWLKHFTGDPLILFSDVSPIKRYLQNIITGEIWALFPYKEPYVDQYFISWSREGCEIIFSNNSVGGRVIRTNLYGEVIQELYSFEHLNAVIRNIALSPSEKMMAYEAVGLVYRPEDNTYTGRFLEIVNLDDPSSVYRLSERNDGEGMVAWSPDEKWLAYAEYDGNDVLQVHIVRPDGRDNYQLTQYTKPEAHLTDLRWSPDSQRIIFLSHPSREDYSGTGLFMFTMTGQQPLAEPIEVEGGHVLGSWWQDENTLIYYNGASIYSINLLTGEPHELLNRSEVPEGTINWPEPFGTPSLIGFFSLDFDKFFIYNITTDMVSELNDIQIPDVYLESWESVPATYPGLAECKP